jgi:hypothetical protein
MFFRRSSGMMERAPISLFLMNQAAKNELNMRKETAPDRAADKCHYR